MGDNENIEVLIHALKEQTQIMSETYNSSTERMCNTIEKLDKTRTIQSVIIVAIVFVFLLLIYLF